MDGKFKGPGRVGMPVTGSSPAFRTALWSNMEKLMDQIFNSCAQVRGRNTVRVLLVLIGLLFYI